MMSEETSLASGDSCRRSSSTPDDIAADEQVKVTATDAWLRIDARYGAVVRRRHALLPLLV